MTRALAAILSLSLAAPAAADEGMWPVNLFPREEVEKRHGVEVDPALLERLLRASVRMNNGGSGSFVSADGLVLTNHHVGRDCISKLSSRPGATDLMLEGFVAKAREDELRCPDLEVNALVSIEDVTARVEAAAASPSATDADRNAMKKAEMTRIEKACADETGLRCDVVTLWGGGAHHLYRYEKYTDVRLVFAPEDVMENLGGEELNFNYPRVDLDMALFRAWRDGAPAKTPVHLSLSRAGPQEGQTILVSGHPGSTDRLAVPAKLEALRDVVYPFLLERWAERRKRLEEVSRRGEAFAKAARAELFSTMNAQKAVGGFLAGLRDPAVLDEARRRHDAVKDGVRAMPAGERARLLEAWPKLEGAYRAYAGYATRLLVLEQGLAPGGPIAATARHLLRLSEELPKKSEERLREYRDSNLHSLQVQLFSEAPLLPALEVERLAFFLENLALVLGRDDPAVKAALRGKAPRQRAEEVVFGTKLFDVSERRRLYEGGRAALEAAKDPAVELMRAVDAAAREARKRHEDGLEAVERAYAGRIAEAFARVQGRSTYPDATFTLRLSVGVVKGYEEGGRSVPWATRIGDLYRFSKRAQGREPFALPPSWTKAMGAVDFSVPFNFVSTNDIIGGNSGSPAVDVQGRVVGLVFDGNLHQLPNRFVYREERARTVSVASPVMLHALERVYGASHLVDEIAAP